MFWLNVLFVFQRLILFIYSFANATEATHGFYVRLSINFIPMKHTRLIRWQQQIQLKTPFTPLIIHYTMEEINVRNMGATEYIQYTLYINTFDKVLMENLC